MLETGQHKPLCEGHIDCPKCGPESCSKPVVVRSDGAVFAVVCLTCHQRFDVSEAEDDINESPA